MISCCLTSCSYLTEIFLFNDTDDVVQITYAIKRIDSSSLPPVIKEFKRFTRIKNTAEEQAIQYAADSLTFYATLLPKQALQIGAETNFSFKSEYDQQKLIENIDYLEIATSQHKTKHTAATILPNFETYTYQIVGIAISKTMTH